MSHLAEIMNARGITPDELSRLTGLTYPTIWRLLKNDCFDTAFKSTQQKIAAVLGVSVRDIIYGKDAKAITEKEKEEMKNKIVETEVIKATEHLARVLRTYYPEPMHLHISIFTREVNAKIAEDNCEGTPDYYSLRVAPCDEDEIGEYIINHTARAYYTSDECGNEKIVQTVPYYKRGRQNE